MYYLLGPSWSRPNTMRPRLLKGIEVVLEQSCLQEPLGNPLLPRLQGPQKCCTRFGSAALCCGFFLARLLTDYALHDCAL